MEVHVFLLQLALILMAARLFGEISARWGMPPVIGELAAGILLGPSLLGLVQVSETLHFLAEIGIILLLFEVGLDTELNRLAKAGGKATTVALGGFILPFVLGFGLSYYTFEMSLLTSLVLGGTLTATSIGITVRVLTDLGRRHSTEGQIILGAAVMDDVLGVLLLALLYEFATAGQVSLYNAAKIGAFMTVFFLMAPMAAKAMSYLIHRYERSSGVPGLFADVIKEQMKPIIRLFTPIFFVEIGMSLELDQVDWGSRFTWIFSLALLAAAMVGKFGGALLIREPPELRTAIGMGMVPRGEVGLVFTELGKDAGLLEGGVYDVLILVIAYTTLLAPFWIKWFYRVHASAFEAPVAETDLGYPDARASGPPPDRVHVPRRE
jgi:Kef-type K+ transport system membrane component KefB